VGLPEQREEADRHGASATEALKMAFDSVELPGPLAPAGESLRSAVGALDWQRPGNRAGGIPFVSSWQGSVSKYCTLSFSPRFPGRPVIEASLDDAPHSHAESGSNRDVRSASRVATTGRMVEVRHHANPIDGHRFSRLKRSVILFGAGRAVKPFRTDAHWKSLPQLFDDARCGKVGAVMDEVDKVVGQHFFGMNDVIRVDSDVPVQAGSIRIQQQRLSFPLENLETLDVATTVPSPVWSGGWVKSSERRCCVRGLQGDELKLEEGEERRGAILAVRGCERGEVGRRGGLHPGGPPRENSRSSGASGLVIFRSASGAGSSNGSIGSKPTIP
jgi:hypothetical protein